MLSILRAVGRSSTYRKYMLRLAREPEDVWYEPGQGWIVIYGIVQGTENHLLAFRVSEPAHAGLRVTFPAVRAEDVQIVVEFRGGPSATSCYRS